MNHRKNNLSIDTKSAINFDSNKEKENINYLPKNYWFNNNNINDQIFLKTPRIPYKTISYNSKKIGFSEVNNNKFLSKINWIIIWKTIKNIIHTLDLGPM